jgi:hypothetical protein
MMLFVRKAPRGPKKYVTEDGPRNANAGSPFVVVAVDEFPLGAYWLAVFRVAPLG